MRCDVPANGVSLFGCSCSFLDPSIDTPSCLSLSLPRRRHLMHSLTSFSCHRLRLALRNDASAREESETRIEYRLESRVADGRRGLRATRALSPAPPGDSRSRSPERISLSTFQVGAKHIVRDL